jgi:hypothetical protein
MPNFSFHIRHGIHSSDHNVDLPDPRAAHEEATMIFGDMARDVAAQLNETPEWRMDVSDESGKSLFRLRLLTEPLEMKRYTWRLLGTGPIFEFGSKSAIGQTASETAL